MRCWLMTVFFVLMTISIFSGCVERSEKPRKSTDNYQKVRLVMTANGTDIGIETLTAKHFAQLVAEESGGNVQIEFYPNDELTGGNTNEAVKALTEGTVDLGAYVSGTMSLLDPRLEVATIPWSFSSCNYSLVVFKLSGSAKDYRYNRRQLLRKNFRGIWFNLFGFNT